MTKPKKAKKFNAQVARGTAMCNLVENLFPSPESKMDMAWNDVLIDIAQTQANARKADEAGVDGEERTEIILTGDTSSATTSTEILGAISSLADAVAKLSQRLDALEQQQPPRPPQNPPQPQQRKKRKRNRKRNNGHQNQTP